MLGELYSFSSDFINAVITHADNVSDKIDFLCKYQEVNNTFTKEITAKLITSLGNPYSDLVIAGKKPHVPFFAEQLVSILKERGFVSSYKKKDDGIRVYTKSENLRIHVGK